jgi:hypothetical protein
MGSKPNECMCMYNLPIKKEDYLSKKDEKKKSMAGTSRARYLSIQGIQIHESVHI